MRSVVTYRNAACPDMNSFVKRLMQQLTSAHVSIKDSLEYIMFAAYECPVASLGQDRV
jgi:hypothetical protein